MTTNFTITNLPDNRLVTEGGSLSLSLTPAGGFTGKIVWQVLFDGKRPATADDFDVLTGTLDFADGTDQAVILSFAANNARLGERSFQLQFYHEANDGTLTPEGEGHHFTLQDSDTDIAALPISRQSSSTGDDIFVLGSHYDYVSDTTAGGGNDLFIITRHQSQNLTIADGLGNNIIKFDHDVVITDIQQFIISGIVLNVNITLGTGAVISIGGPDNEASGGGKRYQYQIGDGAIMSFSDFIIAIGTPTDTEPFTIVLTNENAISDPVASTPLPISRQSSSTGDDIFVLGSHYDYVSDTTAGGGNDLFIITRHQSQNLTIADGLGNNIIKFDHDVVITDIQQFIISGIVLNVNITLGTGAVISIGGPDNDASGGGKRYQYQLGDGVVMDYVDFKAALGTPTTTDPFTVTRPSEEVGDPLFTFDEYLTYDGSFKAFNVSEFGTDPTPTSTSPDLSVANLFYLDNDTKILNVSSQETVDLEEGNDIYLLTEAYFRSQDPNSTLNIIDGKGDNIVVLGKGMTIESLFVGPVSQIESHAFIRVTRDADTGANPTDYYITLTKINNTTFYQEGAGNDSLFELTDYTMVELV